MLQDLVAGIVQFILNHFSPLQVGLNQFHIVPNGHKEIFAVGKRDIFKALRFCPGLTCLGHLVLLVKSTMIS